MSNVKSYLFGLWKNNRPECVCFGFLVVLALFASVVHEPWYDEIQAWQIAKTASLYDIVFRIPHFEGHPPLWFLLLSIPAKIGLSGLISLRIIGLIMLLITGFLLIFKAPFPRWIRFTLPFSYFIFIQYGIIVRPYGLMALLLILLAMAFPSKDEHPGRFVGLLAVLCASHLFGIAIAGGITVAWLWEIKDGRPWGVFLRGLCRDKRFHWMLGLLVWAILVMVDTFPAPGTAADQSYDTSAILHVLFYNLFGLPPDAFFTNLHKYLVLDKFGFKLSFAQFAMLGIGLIWWTFLFALLPKTKRKYLWLPYVMLICLMTLYSSVHHIGLFTLLVIWASWISLQDKHFALPKWPEPVLQIGKLLLMCAVFVSLGWTVNQLFFDISFPVSNAKETVAFLKDNDLLNRRIFSAWKRRVYQDQILSYNTYNQAWAVQLDFYAPYNIFANFHDGGPKMYSSFELLEGETIPDVLARWREGGLPEVLVGEVHLEDIWPEIDREDYYIPVYRMNLYDFWKFDRAVNVPGFVYVRRDVADQLHLQDIRLIWQRGEAS